MAKIQTTVRLITVKETAGDIEKWILEGYDWISITEDTTFVGELTGRLHEGKRAVLLNKGCILEVYD